MIIEFVTNACAIYEVEGFRLVSDPWLIDGAFEGSWCHYPPVKTTPQELAAKADALYISHAHPDHYDEATLRFFRKDIPIIILDQPPNILRRLLSQIGFTNLIVSKAGERCRIGPFEYQLLKAFDEHHFEDASLDNILDSACYLSANGVTVMNFNDNIPSTETCERLASEYPGLTMVQVQYTAAGPQLLQKPLSAGPAICAFGSQRALRPAHRINCRYSSTKIPDAFRGSIRHRRPAVGKKQGSRYDDRAPCSRSLRDDGAVRKPSMPLTRSSHVYSRTASSFLTN